MKTKRIILIGLFAAICFIGTYAHIPISFGGSNSMIHLGTTAIFIAAILIGKDAGLAAAIGCALFDAMDPMFQVWVLPTFIIKGLTGYAVGIIAFARNKKGNSMVQNILAFIVGGVVSLVGYFIVNWLVFVGFHTAVLKMITSLATTGIAVAITIPIAAAVKPIINKSGIKLES
ncbi:ECF transporter S component [Clostridium brassicae]|uniref:ECF transporter S component n=1 Tax=Clostridium brassicae TaxID=2999072 RepID=A0ABT4D4U1_9CLOT|nr:ECF transporter S component [Clostridium brassicae]MCY6957313.1 ECF transporter S component [Clostridium brassicae]